MTDGDMYADARMHLNEAMEEFIKAAHRVDMTSVNIADSIADSLYDASNGDINIEVTIV